MLVEASALVKTTANALSEPGAVTTGFYAGNAGDLACKRRVAANWR